MSETSVPTPAEIISNKPLALAGNEHHNVDTGDPVDYWHWLGQHDAYPEPALEWRGPLAFARAHGALPGIDHEFGIRWGSNDDQRVSLRVEFGSDASLLYVYDPTWESTSSSAPTSHWPRSRTPSLVPCSSVSTWLLRTSSRCSHTCCRFARLRDPSYECGQRGTR